MRAARHQPRGLQQDGAPRRPDAFKFKSRDGVERASVIASTALRARGPSAAAARPDAFFLVDLFVNFNTGFVTADGEVVMCPEKKREELPLDLVPDRLRVVHQSSTGLLHLVGR